MLGEEYSARNIFEYLGELEPTPTLRDIALGVLRGNFAEIWLPKSDDPRSYDQLLGRRGVPFRALIWLSEHGCNIEAELTKLESLVRPYQEAKGIDGHHSSSGSMRRTRRGRAAATRATAAFSL